MIAPKNTAFLVFPLWFLYFGCSKSSKTLVPGPLEASTSGDMRSYASPSHQDNTQFIHKVLLSMGDSELDYRHRPFQKKVAQNSWNHVVSKLKNSKM